MPSVAIVAFATDGPTGAPAFGVQGIAGDPLKKHYGAGVNVVQTLFDFGRTDHMVAARTALLRAAEQDTATQAAQAMQARTTPATSRVATRIAPVPAIPANGTPRWVVPFLAMTQLPTPAPIGPLSQVAAIQRNRWPHLPESIRQD